jgi:hypothetical protein
LAQDDLRKVKKLGEMFSGPDAGATLANHLKLFGKFSSSCLPHQPQIAFYGVGCTAQQSRIRCLYGLFHLFQTASAFRDCR